MNTYNQARLLEKSFNKTETGILFPALRVSEVCWDWIIQGNHLQEALSKFEPSASYWHPAALALLANNFSFVPYPILTLPTLKVNKRDIPHLLEDINQVIKTPEKLSKTRSLPALGKLAIGALLAEKEKPGMITALIGRDSVLGTDMKKNLLSIIFGLAPDPIKILKILSGSTDLTAFVLAANPLTPEQATDLMSKLLAINPVNVLGQLTLELNLLRPDWTPVLQNWLALTPIKGTNLSDWTEEGSPKSDHAIFFDQDDHAIQARIKALKKNLASEKAHLALSYQMNGNQELASETFWDAFVTDPESADIFENLVSRLIKEKNADRLHDAVRVLKETESSLQKHPGTLLASLLSSSLSEEKLPEIADASMQELSLLAHEFLNTLDKRPRSVLFTNGIPVFLERIAEYFKLKNHEELGIQFLREAMRHYPNLSNLHAQAADMLGARGAFSEAAAEAKFAFSGDPANLEKLRGMVTWLEKTGSWKEAFQEWEMAAGNLDTQNLLFDDSDIRRYATAALHSGHPEKTVELINKISDEQRIAQDYLVLGQAVLAQGETDRAILHLNQVITEDSQNPLGYLVLSKAHSLAGNLENSEKILKEGLIATNQNPLVHIALAENYAEAQASTLALEHCHKVLGSSAEENLKEKAALLAHSILDTLGEPRKGKIILKKTLDEFPENTSVALALARTLLKLGESNEAYRLFEDLLERNALTLPADYLGLGRLALELNKSPDIISRSLKTLEQQGASDGQAKFAMQELLAESLLRAGNGKDASEVVETMKMVIPEGEKELEQRVGRLAGKAAFLDKRYQEAIHLLQKNTCSQCPEYAEDRRLVCMALVELGDPARAIEEARSLFLKYPERKDIFDWLSGEFIPKLIQRTSDYLEANPDIIQQVLLPAIDQNRFLGDNKISTTSLKAQLLFLCHEFSAALYTLGQVVVPELSSEQVNNGVRDILTVSALWISFNENQKAVETILSLVNNGNRENSVALLRDDPEAAQQYCLLVNELKYPSLSFRRPGNSMDFLQSLQPLSEVTRLLEIPGSYGLTTKARDLLINKKQDEAAKLVSAATIEDENDIHVSLARFFVARDSLPHQEVAITIEQVSKLLPDPHKLEISERISIAQGLLEITRYLYLGHQYQSAKNILAQAYPFILSIPFWGTLRAIFFTLLCAVSLDLYEEVAAAEALTQLINNPTYNSESQGLSIRLLLRQGEFQQAEQEMAQWNIAEIQDAVGARLSGLAYLESGHWNEAIKVYEKVVVQSWEEPFYLLDQVEMMVKRGEATTLCEKLEVISHRPGDVPLDKSEHKKIIKWLASIDISRFPKECLEKLEGTKAKADLLLSTRIEYPKTIELIEEIKQQQANTKQENGLPALPVFFDWNSALIPSLYYCLLANIAREKEDYRTALHAITTALAIWPDEPRWHLQAARLYHQQQPVRQANIAKAIQHYQEALRLDPSHEETYQELAALHIEYDTPKEALQVLSAGTASLPNRPELWASLGALHANLNHHSDAIKCYDQALAINPAHKNSLVARAELALQTNDPQTAAKMAERALDQMPNHPQVLILLSRSLESIGRVQDALHALQAANELLNLRSIELILENTRLLHKTKQFRAATTLLERALEIHPATPTLLAPYIESLEKDGKINQAIQVAEKMLGVATEDNPPTVQARYHYLLGMLYKKEGKTKETLRHLNACLEKDPLMFNALLEMGDLHREKRQSDIALSYYQRAIRVAPADPRAYLHAGIALKESKDFPGAEAMLSQAAELAPLDVEIQRQYAAVKAVNLIHTRV